VRSAHEALRAGRRAEALRLLEDVVDAAGLALRARILVDDLERAGAAASAASEAIRLDPAAVDPDLATAIGGALLRLHPPADTEGGAYGLLRECAREGADAGARMREAAADDDPLIRGEVAKAPLFAPESLGSLRDDPSAYVRFMARTGGRGARPLDPPEDTATRLFGAHGPDFETGLFVAFQTSYQARLAFFEASFFRAVDALLGGRGPRMIGFGGQYGLGYHRDAVRGDLHERVERINASALLPFDLEVSGPRPFDHLVGLSPSDTLSADDERLARRLARDLSGHPARLRSKGAAPPTPGEQQLHHRLLVLFPPGRTPSDEQLDPILFEARAQYGPVGYRAVERFVEKARADAPGGMFGAPLGPRGWRKPPPEDDPR
jgi:hypothetical protein